MAWGAAVVVGGMGWKLFASLALVAPPDEMCGDDPYRAAVENDSGTTSGSAASTKVLDKLATSIDALDDAPNSVAVGRFACETTVASLRP